jgi:hypothetical protein
VHTLHQAWPVSTSETRQQHVSQNLYLRYGCLPSIQLLLCRCLQLGGGSGGCACFSCPFAVLGVKPGKYFSKWIWWNTLKMQLAKGCKGPLDTE